MGHPAAFPVGNWISILTLLLLFSYNCIASRNLLHFSLICDLKIYLWQNYSSSPSEQLLVPWPGGSVDWSVILYTKKLQVPPLSGHTPKLQFWPQVTAHMEGNQSISLCLSVCLSLSLSVCLSLKSINISSGEGQIKVTSNYNVEEQRLEKRTNIMTL